jgi:type III pantothenate kinase
MLLLDIGNSRIKAAVADPGGLRLLGSAAYRAPGLAAALDGLGLPAVERGLAAVVAGPGIAQALDAWAGERGMSLRRIRPEAESAGVRCGYTEPARLGADRWAALVGARQRTRGPCLVVDAGSAVTVDAMAADGRHLGGFIIPGLALMATALRRETGDLEAFSAASARGTSEGFPTDTRPAIEEGALLAVVGLVREAAARMPGPGSPAILVTGGDGGLIVGRIEGAREAPALVLEGLARLGNPSPGIVAPTYPAP